jgi:hypothetical protein
MVSNETQELPFGPLVSRAVVFKDVAVENDPVEFEFASRPVLIQRSDQRRRAARFDPQRMSEKIRVSNDHR